MPSTVRIVRAAPHLASAVREEAQPPTGRDLRIEVLQRPGRRVAGVGEFRLARGLALLVDPLELGVRHEDLAPHLEQAWRTCAAARAQLQRHGTDRADLRGDVVALLAVAARDGEHEPNRFSYRRLTAMPSIFGSQTNATDSRRRRTARRRRHRPAQPLARRARATPASHRGRRCCRSTASGRRDAPSGIPSPARHPRAASGCPGRQLRVRRLELGPAPQKPVVFRVRHDRRAPRRNRRIRPVERSRSSPTRFLSVAVVIVLQASTIRCDPAALDSRICRRRE